MPENPQPPTPGDPAMADPDRPTVRMEAPVWTGLAGTPGDRLGRYRLIRQLGRGGMGVVYLAEDEELSRRVAVKILAPRDRLTQEDKSRFLREARAMGALRHENVITIFDVGYHGDSPFLAMELLEGEPLSERLRRDRRLPLDGVLLVARGIAAGLAAAHGKGLVHRDVKPGNVWLEAGEGTRGPQRAKLLDFGLARPMATDSQVTHEGMVVGTPAYMAPEQARGAALDGRADLWSLGCILFEMTAGRHPFGEGPPMTLLTRAATMLPPSPRTFDPSLPPALADLTLRLLSKAPEQRPESATEVVAALEAIASATPVSRPAGPVRSHLERLQTLTSSPPPMDVWDGSPSRPVGQTSGLSLVIPRADPRSMPGENTHRDLRLLLEELCSDLCRFEHVSGEGFAPEEIRIEREVELENCWVDIRVTVPGRPCYFVEIKIGYSLERLADSLRRKYGAGSSAARQGASHLVLVFDTEAHPDWEAARSRITEVLAPSLELRVWNGTRLAEFLRHRFGTSIDSLSESHLTQVRRAVDRAKAFHAFGSGRYEDFAYEPLHAQILWHLGFWRARQISDRHGLGAEEILRPGIYSRVVVLIADLCGFTSFVRDTSDPTIIASALTAFYSRARYEILNAGGMFLRFSEDKVTGVFGVPESWDGLPADALNSARALSAIGRSVLHQWQSEIERVQEVRDVRVTLAVGDVQLVCERPFSHSHVGLIGEPAHTASALLRTAAPGEISITNSFHRWLDPAARAGFVETDPVEVARVGKIRAWKCPSRPATPTATAP